MNIYDDGKYYLSLEIIMNDEVFKGIFFKNKSFKHVLNVLLPAFADPSKTQEQEKTKYNTYMYVFQRIMIFYWQGWRMALGDSVRIIICLLVIVVHFCTFADPRSKHR